MNQKTAIFFLIAILVLGAVFATMRDQEGVKTSTILAEQNPTGLSAPRIKTAMLAGGCFWCVEHDLEKLPGVIDVVSGYAGGTTENPTYENYAGGGHREVVLTTYDPNKVSFANLVEHIIKHGDPTDAKGSFNDRGLEYAPAIYAESEEERVDARRVIDAVDASRVFDRPLPILVLSRVPFWPAEEYHQNYAARNPLRYGYYRNASGRDAFIAKYWGDDAEAFTFSSAVGVKVDMVSTSTAAWKNYTKPSETVLRALLTPLQYEVTQEDGTERPFDNIYDKNNEDGMYVDILSGEPLYSSKDKYDSGTGWPSFVKPIVPDAIVLREDKGLFSTRTEVRSRLAASHLGHVFDDGPADRGGKRYCMNSAAMRFIPLADMEKEGYGDYIQFVR
jgi:peptide methionine sulfoxide reductase msrA/msrB